MDETQNVGTSMRKYIQVVDSEMGANNAPISAIPTDMIKTRVSQIMNALRELHAASAQAPATEETLGMLDQACALLLQAAGAAVQASSPEDEGSYYPGPEQQVEESSPTTPEAMAPSVDQQGHRSYSTPSGDSYAQRKGFTG